MKEGEAPAQRRLPGNPNAVVFAADASVVFDRRPWRRVAELALGPLQSLHLACRLPVAAGFGWRVALDRRNRRKVQITLYFVVDGPLAPQHLDGLERTLSHNAVPWTNGQVERVPPNGVLVWLAADGIMSWLVHPSGEAYSARAMRWGKVDGRDAVQLFDVDLTVPAADDVPADVPWAVGLPPAADAVDTEVERMRFAFARAFARRIVEADGVVQTGEQRFMDQVFAPDLVHRLGLSTPSDEQACFDAALRELPHRLGHHDKLALIGLFFSACCSDGGLDAREMRALKEAADALGVERDRVVKYLQRFW